MDAEIIIKLEKSSEPFYLPDPEFDNSRDQTYSESVLVIPKKRYSKRCVKRCNITGTFWADDKRYCKKHRPDSYIEIVYDLCIICQVIRTSKGKSYCGSCKPLF